MTAAINRDQAHRAIGWRIAIPTTQAAFALFVGLPTAIAALYFGILASDIYVSESRFVVRSATHNPGTALGSILGSGLLASTSQDSYAVVDYIRSRDALREADRDGFVERIFGQQRVAWLDRFGNPLWGTTREELYRYFSAKIDIEFDTSTDVTALTVRAFTPQDAHDLNERLLDQSEQLVNRLNERARRDSIASARATVAQAAEQARKATLALARFRNASGISDPDKQAAINLQMIAKLQDQMIADQTELDGLRRYTPANPQIPALTARIASIAAEIAKQSSGVAGSRTSLSTAAQTFQQLQFNAEFADKQLATALATMQDAENEARRQQIYIERIAEPDQPDYAIEPRRLRAIAATLVLGLIAWGMATTLLAGIREHRD